MKLLRLAYSAETKLNDVMALAERLLIWRQTAAPDGTIPSEWDWRGRPAQMLQTFTPLCCVVAKFDPPSAEVLVGP